MEKLFRLFLVTLIISSCSKNNSDQGGSTQPVLPDTLSAGWTKITSLPNENFTDIYFGDNNTGYAVSNNAVYKTINSGDAWTNINNTTGGVNIGGFNAERAIFLNASPTVYVTQNGGTIFTNPGYPNPGGGNPAFFDCVFTSIDTCFLSSSQYIWKSVDGGLTIDTAHLFSSRSPISSLFFLNGQEGWVMRLDGLYKTTDGADTWTVDTTLVSGFGTVQFTDSNTGYFSYYGTINKTTDGGATWLPVFQANTQTFADIHFLDPLLGYVGVGNKIYKTTDAGATWTREVALGNQFISKIFFTDSSHGWASTSDGTIVRFVQ